MSESADREELAWAAGFFDGEGSTYLLRSGGRKYAVIGITQINRDVLDRFVNAVGCGKVYGPYPLSRSNPKPSWRVYVSARLDVIRVVEQLRPWLGKVKREQAERVFEADTRLRGMAA